MIIKTNDELLQYVPNVFATVEGESSLFDKIESYLEGSEQWLIDNVIGEMLYFNKQQDDIKTYCGTIIACDAMIAAIPMLDVVLTPNGFGIVSNSNIAPASKERIERLISHLEMTRDSYMNIVVKSMSQCDEWRQTKIGTWWGATLFPNLDITINEPCHKWQKYCELRNRVMAIEMQLAYSFFSPELLDALRAENFVGTSKRQWLTAMIKNIVVNMLRDSNLNRNAIYDIVEEIRTNPEEFPEWQNTATAALFSPPTFSNTKENHGYWF